MANAVNSSDKRSRAQSSTVSVMVSIVRSNVSLSPASLHTIAVSK